MEEAKDYESLLDSLSDSDVSAVGFPDREAIGSLMYLMIGTRPDLADAVGKLSQFNEKPKVKHWMAVKRVLTYVNGTSTLG